MTMLPPSDEPLPSEARSWLNVVSATRQPSSSAPTRFPAGTTASLRKTSLNDERPVISRSGRTSTPGWSMSITK